MNYKLVKPEKSHEEMWKIVIAEFNDVNEKVVPFALSMNMSMDNYDEYLAMNLKYETNNNIPSEHVPANTFFLMDETEDKILGAVNIRWYLNQNLLEYSGHIGYGVAPSERGKGCATAMLHLALKYCRSIGLRKVLVTCDEDNEGSKRTIIKNGGVFEDDYTQDNGTVVLRYWITI